MIMITTLLSENKHKHTFNLWTIILENTKLIDIYLNKWLDTFNISDKKQTLNGRLISNLIMAGLNIIIFFY